ncbi:MAG TPA: carboxyl transferase domain-containing protein [Solirubrobacterales bacterium]|nr:carboxyl transferase domain-containing protein [Solirubrobacterales bacterium]
MSDRTQTSTQAPAEKLAQRRAEALEMGGAERVERHHDSGRLTARERIDLLVDAGTWREIGLLALPEIRRDAPSPADAIVTGLGRISGRMAAIVAIDATVLAGTTAPVNMRKQNRLAEWAGKRGIPVVFLSDNDGGRLPDLLGWRFSGVPFDFDTFLQSPPGCPAVPRITAILGPSFGDAALHAAIADLVVMRRDASIALSGPPVIKGAIGEDISAEDLGGPAVAHDLNGSAHVLVDTEAEAIEAIKGFLTYLPDAADLPAPGAPGGEPETDPAEIAAIVPEHPRRGYDMRAVLRGIVDAGSLFEWGERYGPSLICGLARIEGGPVGIVASQPMQRAGVLDVAALTKERRFVELCDTFNIPLAFLQDVPGLMIGAEAERGGILRCYEQLAAALARAGVPKVAVIVRKAYGGGHFALGGRPVKPDLLVAWPGAEMGFMAPDTGVRTVYRRRLEALDGPERDALAAELEAEWEAESQPWEAAANIILDDIIDPATTRQVIAEGIEFAWGTRPRVSSRGG